MRLIAFDLDGTLLDHDKTIPARSLDVVRQLRAHGCKIAVITGRALVPSDVQEGLMPDATATNNGGVVLVGEKLVAEHRFTPAQLRALIDLLPPEADAWAFGPEAVYTRQPAGVPLDWLEGRESRTLEQAVDEAVYQLSFRLEGARRLAQGILEVGGLTVTGGLPPYGAFMTVTPRDANKGSALREIAAALRISMKDTIVFGDSDNDVDMFKVAGIAVQVGEAECLIDHAHQRVSCSALGLPGWLENYLGELARELA